MSFFIKTKNSRIDYPFLWKPWLNPQSTGRYITSSSFTIDGPDSELEKSNETYNNILTNVVLSGGTIGETYTITNTINTNDGLIESDEIKIKIT